MKNRILLLLLFVISAMPVVRAQSTAFSYQGKLTDGGSPANGSFLMQFKLFDALSGGNQVGSTLTDISATASQGIFSVTLDFGTGVFTGANRWLEIAIRHNGGELYVTLSPREQIASSPYSVRTLSAAMADDSQKLGGVAANQYVQTTDPRLSDARNPLPNSANYIQNTQSQQPAADFNVSGNGTVGTLNVGGATTVAGTSPPAVAPSGQARFFFNTATNKFRLSENGGAYVDLVGANGVSGSGTTNKLPLFSAATTLADSAIAQSGTNIGIGTITPVSKLEIVGPGSQIRFGSSTTDNGGYLISGVPSQAILAGGARWDGTNWIAKDTGASLFNNFAGHMEFFTNSGLTAGTTFSPTERMRIDSNGNVGIGTTSPTNTLDVYGFFRASHPAGGNVVSETTGGTNAWAKFWVKTPVQQWSIGSSNSFNGNQLYFSNETAGQILMDIMPNGNVGIGTVAPAVKLHVFGSGTLESSVQSSNERAVLSLNSTVSGQNRVWTMESGLYGVPGLFGIYDRTAGRAALTVDANGLTTMDQNVRQGTNGYGFPKALLYVNGDGTLLRCYNGITGSSTGGCLFSVTRHSSGYYTITLGFDTGTRFILVSPQDGGGSTPIGISYQPLGSSLDVFVYDTSGSGIDFNRQDRPFTVVIY